MLPPRLTDFPKFQRVWFDAERLTAPKLEPRSSLTPSIFTSQSVVLAEVVILVSILYHVFALKTVAPVATVAPVLSMNINFPVDSNLIPAFNGLGAPWWDENASALIDGLTFSVKVEDLASAAIDSIALQVTDVINAMRSNNIEIKNIKVDGGASKSLNLMQRQANFANADILVSEISELSAVGAAFMAGTSINIWTKLDIENFALENIKLSPAMSEESRVSRINSWHRSLNRSRAEL